MANATDLADRTAVVTGASSGIGRATALALADRGCHVLVHARQRADAAWETCRLVEQRQRRSHVLLADFRDEAASRTLVERAWDWQGHIDIWINNAGADVLTGDAQHEPFDRKLQQLWQVDVAGTVHATRAVAERMCAEPGVDPGCIVNMGWDQAETGMEGDSGQLFAATKGAVMAFTQSAAKTYAPHVRIVCVAPGWIRTAWGVSAAEPWQERARRESLLGRWGSPEDVAEVIAFLCSPAASFVNAQIIKINGGHSSSRSR